MAIAIIEHSQMINPSVSTYDICERLGDIWREIAVEISTRPLNFETECIIALNHRIAICLKAEPGDFLDQDSWASFVEECGDIREDPDHVLSWIFSSLYWQRLTTLKISTVWLLINAIKIQNNLPENKLTVQNIGSFLECLSSSGPPIYDGQTFSLDAYNH